MTKFFHVMVLVSKSDEQDPFHFKLIQPDVDFLKRDLTDPTLLQVGHLTCLWQYQEINLITDAHFNQRASPVNVQGWRY